MAVLTHKGLKTLTGIPAEEIAIKLAAHFPANAYKKVDGVGANLTDINTGYMIERCIEVFGPRGMGWMLDYQPVDMEIIPNKDATKSRVTAHLKYATFKYIMVDEQGNPATFGIVVSGASSNDLAYAAEGARTAAIGSALKALGFQLDLYKGLLDHSNAASGGKTAQPTPPSKTKTAAPATQNAAPTNGNGAEKHGNPMIPESMTKPEFLAWATEKGLDGAGITAALKGAGFTKFDQSNMVGMQTAVLQYLEASKQAA